MKILLNGAVYAIFKEEIRITQVVENYSLNKKRLKTNIFLSYCSLT